MQNWGGAYATLKKGLTEVTKAAHVAVQQTVDIAKDIADEQLGNAKVVKDYRVRGVPVASSGPLDAWKIYTGTARNPSALVREVSVWVLDKKALIESNKQICKPRDFELFFEQQRRNCSQMARIKHPGVLKVIEPLEESSSQMVLVTEAVIGSLRNVMGSSRSAAHAANAAALVASPSVVAPSVLECKLGLLQLADTLAFLHANVHIALCGLNPQVVMLAQGDGGWKIAAFAHSAKIGSGGLGNDGSSQASTGTLFAYPDPFPAPWDEAAKPLLSYLAPELVAGWGAPTAAPGVVSPAADVFSLALLAAEVLPPSGVGNAGCGGSPLLPVRSNVHDYRARVAGLAAADVPGLPTQTQDLLRSMLSTSPMARPDIMAFQRDGLFQEDRALRGLRFLDSMLQREPAHKLAFTTDLMSFWQQYDPRLLRAKVLPPLLTELRSPAMQLSVLPVVMAILKAQGSKEFMAVWLSQLKPLLEGAEGELLQALLLHRDVLAELMTADAFNSAVMPLYLRALDSGQPRMQHEALRQLSAAVAAGVGESQSDEHKAFLRSVAGASPAGSGSSATGAKSGLSAGGALPLAPAMLRSAILPRALQLCLSTTSAAVRCAALSLMSYLALTLAERSDSNQMLDIAAQVSAVDQSAGTTAAIAVLCDALSRRWGADMTATRLLPLLTPLLISPVLTSQQFSGLMTTIRDMLGRVQQKVLPEIAQRTMSAASGPGATPSSSHSSWDMPLPPSPLPLSSNSTSASPSALPATAAMRPTATGGLSGQSMSTSATAPASATQLLANRQLPSPPVPSSSIDLVGGLSLTSNGPVRPLGTGSAATLRSTDSASVFDPFAASMAVAQPAVQAGQPRQSPTQSASNSSHWSADAGPISIQQTARLTGTWNGAAPGAAMGPGQARHSRVVGPSAQMALPTLQHTSVGLPALYQQSTTPDGAIWPSPSSFAASTSTGDMDLFSGLVTAHDSGAPRSTFGQPRPAGSTTQPAAVPAWNSGSLI